MVWFNNLALAKKLAIAFGLCTLITLGIGAVGMKGIVTLNSLLDSVLNNNLRSITQLNDAKSNVIAHNRDLFRLMSMTYSGASQEERDRITTSLRGNQGEVEKPFSAYRATPLEGDEKAAGDAFEQDWKGYLAGVDAAIGLLRANDVAGASRVIDEQAQPSYR